ncbi:hypothetical protein RP20_CCG011815 [Aedes albopictus]|nr:hypothetical protein RP20_CCG011815 [Aedes albopictus]
MLGVAAAFKYKERDVKITGAQVIAQIVHDLNGDSHCWLMEGSAYIWGFLVPAVVLLFAGFYLACQGGGAVKIAAALQIDSRAKNKLVKKRGLQIGLFFKELALMVVSVPKVAHISKAFLNFAATPAVRRVSFVLLVRPAWRHAGPATHQQHSK